MKKKTLSLFLVFILLFALLPLQATAQAADYTPQADTLHALGLFLGTPSGYNLDRDMTRAEAGTMVVRLLGKESEAQNAHYKHPFTDVPEWANDYIGYLYEFDITKGTSATRYGSDDKVTPAQYATFMLRSLSYDDAAGDFNWQQALGKMSTLGIITKADADAFGKTANMPRGTAVALSYAALLARPKGSYYPLLMRLYSDEQAFTAEQLAAAAQNDPAVAQIAAMLGVPRAGAGAGTAMNPEGLFKAASASVFYIEVFSTDEIDEEYPYPYGSGSGFFIKSDGIAVTNYHVIQNARSARIMTTDGEYYDVDRVLAYSAQYDIAIIQIKGSGFPALPLGDPAKLRTGQRVCAIGSPLGFKNTIADGLVSSPVRPYVEAEDRVLIQISVPISEGSSGGALINEFGEVVGITTYSTWGQNLNFAVPVTQITSLTYLDPPKTLAAVSQEAAWAWYFSGWEEYVVKEEEPNNQKPVQTPASWEEYYCTISDKNDVDLFALTADTAQEFFMVLRTVDMEHRDHLRVDVINLDTGAVVFSPSALEYIPYMQMMGHLKKGGRFALRVMTDGSSAVEWSDTPYEFSCVYTETPVGPTMPGEYFTDETHPNDTFDTATYVPFGFTVWGMLSGSEDKAYLHFIVDEKTETSIIFEGIDSWSWENVPLKGVLYNAAREKVMDLKPVVITDGTIAINTRTLAAGDYYIEISGGSEEYTEYICYIGSLNPEYLDYIQSNLLQLNLFENHKNQLSTRAKGFIR